MLPTHVGSPFRQTQKKTGSTGPGRLFGRAATLGAVIGLLFLSPVLAFANGYPTLDSVSLRNGPGFNIGDMLTFDYTAASASSALARVTVQVRNSCGGVRELVIFDAGALPLAGSVSRQIDIEYRQGQYTLAQVLLQDHSGAQAFYSSDGTLNVYSPGQGQFALLHDLDMSVADFAIGDPAAAECYPTLDSVSLRNGPGFNIGDMLTFDYTAASASSALARVTVQVRNSCGGVRELVIFDAGALPLAGPVSKQIDIEYRQGQYTLAQVTLQDHSGAQAFYYSDGTLNVYSGQGQFALHHDLDMSVADFAIGDPAAGCQITVSLPISTPLSAFSKTTQQKYTTRAVANSSARGTVASTPAGIMCPPTCSAIFPSSNVVTLTATAGHGYHFAGWTGDCDGGGTCQTLMNLDRQVEAIFTADECMICSGDPPNCEPRALGAPCSPDTISCTDDDICDGAGMCLHLVDAASCDDGNPCTQDFCDSEIGCTNAGAPMAPDLCRGGAKSKFILSDRDITGGDKLAWKWTKGDAFGQADLGTPDVDTTYALCVYDSTSGVPDLAASIVVEPSASLWQSRSPRGWAYSDSSGSSFGATKIGITPGSAGKPKIQFSAGGINLDLPGPINSKYFSQEPSVLVQLRNDAGQCWTSEFLPERAPINSPTAFKASSP